MACRGPELFLNLSCMAAVPLSYFVIMQSPVKLTLVGGLGFRVQDKTHNITAVDLSDNALDNSGGSTL